MSDDMTKATKHLSDMNAGRTSQDEYEAICSIIHQTTRFCLLAKFIALVSINKSASSHKNNTKLVMLRFT
jgi:hypothetical protein